MHTPMHSPKVSTGLDTAHALLDDANTRYLLTK